MTIDQGDILAAWADKNTDETSKLIDLMVAATLLRYGQNYITVTKHDLLAVAKHFEVMREVTKDGHWVIRVRPREIASEPVDSAKP